MLNGLNFIMLYVPDLTAALPFYTQKLGLEIDNQSPAFVQFKPSAGQGASLALAQKGSGQPMTNVELWWFVDNADATLAELIAQGVEVIDQPVDEPFGRTFSIKDPAGHTLYMLQLARA